MKKVRVNRKEILLKFIAITVASMIVISSISMIELMTKASSESEPEPVLVNQSYQTRPCEVSSVLSQGGEWVSFDSSTPGTPAEAHVTISDTSGITIVADFYGFYRNNVTINGTEYDDLEMPGASSIHEAGVPMLPCLYEYVEIPHAVHISTEVLDSSAASTSGYDIRPAPPPIIPVGAGESTLNSSPYTTPPTFFDQVYSNNNFFPGNVTNTEGESNTSTMVMRGHRVLGLSLYPVQYNPVTDNLTVYSQLVIRLKYNVPAEILPIAESLRSEPYERILNNTLLNYDSYSFLSLPVPGTCPGYQSLAQDLQDGAEYLIITSSTFKDQANRLANWKQRKGVPSAVEFVSDGITPDEIRDEVKGIIVDAYDSNPAPTYVLLFGDVDIIPANYDFIHKGLLSFLPFVPVFQGSYNPLIPKGYIASDLGYFNIDGHGYIPDMIYGRISVDTEEQAEIIVDKILQYEQSPPDEDSFYNNILSAGYFHDKPDTRDGTEDVGIPFIYTLERIRHHLVDEYGYTVHINYSSAFWHEEPIKFQNRIDPSISDSNMVSWSLPSGHEWLWGYDSPEKYLIWMRNNITENFNDGRFLVLYYGHGGSKNMIYLDDWNDDGDYNRNDRDLVEGWHSPYYNTSYFSDLTNGDETPLILSIGCSSGWFDGETDEQFLDLVSVDLGPGNPFEDYKNECFAENITRLLGGGAIAAIAPSRPAYAVLSGYLLDGIIRALYPGHLESDPDRENQPIYEMGAALLYGKLHAKREWTPPWICINDCPGAVRTTFEEYHLFGDPEVRLWTDTPTDLTVTYPPAIGTTDPQSFVVTVLNGDTGDGEHFAKVCIQGDEIYEVGYTNPNGQVYFDVAPSAIHSHINVTVTKHNFVPHIGVIDVYHSDARVSVTPKTAFGDSVLTISFTGFPLDAYLNVFADGYLLAANLTPGTTEYYWTLWPGPTRYLNVWVVVAWGGPVAVYRIQRVASDDGPDPYTYSQNDQYTWDGQGLLWDNPEIDLFDLDGNILSSLSQGEVQEIRVRVSNYGSIPADSTTVTLSYSPFIGSISMTPVGVPATVSPTRYVSKYAYFRFEAIIPHNAVLRVDLWHPEEREGNENNNIGYECTDVIEMSSPGESILQVGNPTGSTEYVFIKVKQTGDCEDVWNATIRGYSSQAMSTGDHESMTLFVDSLFDIELGEWRLFTAEVFVNNVLIGGMFFNATGVEPPIESIYLGLILLIGGGIAVVVAIAVINRKK